jgi:hypothetical protein
MADGRLVRLILPSALLLAFTWGLYFYVTSVAGFDEGVFETVVASSALLVAFLAVSLGLARYMKSRRAQRLDQT